MFVHLRTHTEFSVSDGTLRVDDVVAAAAKDGQGALAITDLSNTFGAVKFYSAARKKGIKPLIGCDVWLEGSGDAAAGGRAADVRSGSVDSSATRLLLLVQNHQGYLNLCELLTRGFGYSAAQVAGKPGRLQWPWLVELNAGLIVLSGADQGAVGQALLAGDKRRATDAARQLAEIFAGRFYIELQRAGLPTNEAHVQAAVPLAAELGLPVVATHPVQFLTPDDYEAHEARVCIADGEMLANPRRVRRFSEQQYFKSQADMRSLFADVPTALQNTVEIARRCNLSLTLGKPMLPNFPTPDGLGLDDYFRHASFEGLDERLAALYPSASDREQQRPRYVERLEFEIATIAKMGFPGYFLIVADFINWAKANGMPGRPGPRLWRGLAGGLRARHHRPGPAGLQPAVRALPEPGTRVDARLRHRLLHGQPRPRDRLCEAEVRCDASARSSPTAPWPRRPPCATWGACST
jgi:DNA polymerase III subunit alpha